jgi:hypothetical protein
MADERGSRANVRLALVLASIALVFFLGFIAKMALLG